MGEFDLLKELFDLNFNDLCLRRDAAETAKHVSPETETLKTVYTVEVPTMGFKPDEINVTVDRNDLTLTIRAERAEMTNDDNGYSSYGSSMCVTRTVPENVDVETLEKHFEDEKVVITGRRFEVCEDGDDEENIIIL